MSASIPESAQVDNFRFSSLLPLRAAEVTLRFTGPARFAFFHQPALTGWIRSLLGESPGYENLLTIDAPECGRDRYCPGNDYRFAIYCLAGGEPMLAALIELLRALPISWHGVGRPMPLHDNVKLVSLRDLFADSPMTTVTALRQWGLADLAGEAALWSASPAPRLRFLSPVHLSLPANVTSYKPVPGRTRPRGGKKDVAQDRRDVNLDLVRSRTEEAFVRLIARRGEPEPERSAPTGIVETGADLFWVDCSYRDSGGHQKKLGGLMGTLDLPGPRIIPDEDWLLWVLGQYVGIGQQRAFGWGRYRIESGEGEYTANVATRFASLLSVAANTTNLERAHAAILANRAHWLRQREEFSAAEDDPDEAPEDDPEPDRERLGRVARQLAECAYQPRPLRPAAIPKSDGTLRHLAVPPFIDRVAQRAVLQVLAPPVEQLLAEGTFGFRAGLSRQDAIREVQRAHRDGFRWLYEADIDDFFATVDWQRLLTRLRALYRDDPIVDLLLAWMQAPVEDGGQWRARSAGLPQGAPLSPLLANLFLDDFDADMENAGFRLLRYADDFVVLCRSEDEARQAAQRVEQSLGELGLTIEPNKSGIKDFDRGFRWLGYLVAGSLVLDVGGKRTEVPRPGGSPPLGWLARTATRSPRSLDPERLESFLRPPDAVVSGAERAPCEGATLIVTGEPALVHLEQSRIAIERDGKVIRHFPLRSLGQILLIGPHNITTPAMRAALDAGITVHLASQTGRYVGATWPGQPASLGFELWIAQQQRFAGHEDALQLARSVVESRLRHQREVMRQREVAQELLGQMDTVLGRISGAASTTELNGFEGRGAEVFFSALRPMVPKQFGFETRNRQPPLDPFNAVLSLGYTVLNSHVDTLLRVVGLLPWVGFYHQPHGRSPCLVNDLMEPFRDLVERHALDFIRRPDLSPADFEPGEQGACHLTDHARRDFLAGLDDCFRRPVCGIGETIPGTLHEHIDRQNWRLIQWIRNDVEEFIPWRRR